MVSIPYRLAVTKIEEERRWSAVTSAFDGCCAPPRWGSPLPREHSTIDRGQPKAPKKLELRIWVNPFLASGHMCRGARDLCSLYHRTQTCTIMQDASAKCQKRTSHCAAGAYDVKLVTSVYRRCNKARGCARDVAWCRHRPLCRVRAPSRGFSCRHRSRRVACSPETGPV